MPRKIKAVLKAKGGPTRYWQGVPNKVASECIATDKMIIYENVNDVQQNKILSSGLCFSKMFF